MVGSAMPPATPDHLTLQNCGSLVGTAPRARATVVRPKKVAMSQKNATNSAVPSLDPPEVQALFGDPPLMRGEDIGAYNKLLDQFGELVEPTDVLEWLLLKDIADHT